MKGRKKGQISPALPSKTVQARVSNRSKTTVSYVMPLPVQVLRYLIGSDDRESIKDFLDSHEFEISVHEEGLLCRVLEVHRVRGWVDPMQREED